MADTTTTTFTPSRMERAARDALWRTARASCMLVPPYFMTRSDSFMPESMTCRSARRPQASEQEAPEAEGLVGKRHTDSVCFANNPELHRIAGSTSGTRFAPTRFARIERALQPIQSESVSGNPQETFTGSSRQQVRIVV
ncbi:hypothetical protein GCM10008959_03200 [Deinococcus seoulensis]|uniref:Uncharacterized protein n=1 Tax=Deinococcus seoulensis TaxID=1837379 RepID=A0ABQ2RPK5_9DEIO|nr:hypothetical protein GCM10008959_03200 [Deinococcus seoulensis]